MRGAVLWVRVTCLPQYSQLPPSAPVTSMPYRIPCEWNAAAQSDVYVSNANLLARLKLLPNGLQENRQTDGQTRASPVTQRSRGLLVPITSAILPGFRGNGLLRST